MRYRAFISYSSADRTTGERFQRALEHYRIPKPLRGVDRGHGPVPKRLTPIFRDRSDASAGPDLSGALKAALAISDALVILCSPAAAASTWVNSEIRAFKALGRGARIIPVIVSGAPRRFDPHVAPTGAFPPALFQQVDEAGQIVAETDSSPLAADVRPEGDGVGPAKLKVVAALTGIPLTELTARQLEAERRERLFLRTIAAIIALLVVGVVVAGGLARVSAKRAAGRMASLIELVSGRIDTGAKFTDTSGIHVDEVRAILKEAEASLMTVVMRESTGVPMLEMQRARLQFLFSRLFGVVGDRDQQLRHAREGTTTLSHIPVSRHLSRPTTWFTTLPSAPDLASEQLGGIETLALAMWGSNSGDPDVNAMLERGRDMAQSAGRLDYVARFWSLLGTRAYYVGDLVGASAAQDAALKALDRYLGDSPGGVASVDRAVALSDLSQLLLESNKPEDAFKVQATAIKAFEAQAGAAPLDNLAHRRLGQALCRLADQRYAVTGSWAVSETEFERARVVFERIHLRDPARLDYARDLSVVLERLGDVRLQSGDLGTARTYYDRLQTLREAQFGRYPDSADARRDLAVALERQGDVARGTGDPAGALVFFEEAFARHGVTEPPPEAASNLVLARDLAVLWSKTGAARQGARSTKPWREAHEKAIALMTPFLVSGAAPEGWYRDVGVFHVEYGDGLLKAGSIAQARSQWRLGLALFEKQLAAHPNDPRLPIDRNDVIARLATGRIPDAGAVISPASP
jgi:tetratricopeptide (TPR) repeat protein